MLVICSLFWYASAKSLKSILCGPVGSKPVTAHKLAILPRIALGWNNLSSPGSLLKMLEWIYLLAFYKL